MPRSNRRRPERADASFSRFITGFARTEQRHGDQWRVQPMPPGRSEKSYTCPGCGGTIAIGAGHLVAWRLDGVLGDAADLANRRHWHNHCWKVF